MRARTRTTIWSSSNGRPVSHLVAIVESSIPGKYGLTGRMGLS